MLLDDDSNPMKGFLFYCFDKYKAGKDFDTTAPYLYLIFRTLKAQEACFDVATTRAEKEYARLEAHYLMSIISALAYGDGLLHFSEGRLSHMTQH